ncbi:MAG: CDC27 family protein [Pseudomonadota bacterium]
MRLKYLTTIAAVAAAAFVAPMASAQCAEEVFGAKAGQVYLDAETLLIANDDAPGALQKIEQLKSMELNCYERAAVIRLSAAANVKAGNLLAAARDLEEAINTGGLTGDDRTKTYYQIAQIYLQSDDLPKAKSFLDKWLADGAQPTKDQYMQLAVLSNKMGDNAAAGRYLDSLLQIEPNPDKQTTDFVIYILNETGQKAKLAQFLSDSVIPRFPGEKRYWEVVAGLYFQAEDDRKAFETSKAMYLAGFFTKEDEIMRIVNFYNRFNAPYEAARILEREMNKGRVNKTPEKLETLANLYQVAREYERAIPVIKELANSTNSGKSYERLGRSYFELGEYDEAEQALRDAHERGGLKEPGFAWVLIGQMYHERGNRSAAREAFNNAASFRDGRRASAGWLNFMKSEDDTKVALRVFEKRVVLDEFKNQKKQCDQTKVLGEAAGEPPAFCDGIEVKIMETENEIATIQGEPVPHVLDASANVGGSNAPESDET